MVSSSLLFQSRQARNELHLDSFAQLLDTSYVGEPHQIRLTQLQGKSFTFNAWFSLLTSADGKSAGGIIYGLQSSSRQTRPWPSYHQPIVLVNSTGDLHCSVLDAKPVVAKRLEPNRWYHLALSYYNNHQHQVVYLDGVTIQSDSGALHHEWGYMTHEQVGTGCITEVYEGFPYRGCLGWYGFHGLIDEFRVWNEVLPHESITELSCG